MVDMPSYSTKPNHKDYIYMYIYIYILNLYDLVWLGSMVYQLLYVI